MGSRSNLVPLGGSGHAVLPGVRAGKWDPHACLDATVYIRRRPRRQAPRTGGGWRALLPGHELTSDEFKAPSEADPGDLAKIEAFARERGLSVGEISATRRSVVISGAAAAFNEAFRIELERYEAAGTMYRGHAGPVHVPEDLASIFEGVFGLDDRPPVESCIHHVSRQDPGTAAPGVTYTPLQVANLYGFPAGLDGQGECIALLEFGGGFRDSDLTAYFSNLGVPKPQVSTVSVDNADNNPADPSYPKEVMLDIAVAGAIAPGARIVVYFAPLSERGFVDAVTQAVHDTIYTPSIISISWSGEERRGWQASSRGRIHQAFQEAASNRVTVCCSSGDHGTHDGVMFPASSPFALACGGTRLASQGNHIVSEVVWSEGHDIASGGGVSAKFKRPTWQNGVRIPPCPTRRGFQGRGLPDVAGNAVGYQLLIAGQPTVGNGTSAVAPLWAGLIARLNQYLQKRVGHLNPFLYRAFGPAGVCRDITKGSNGRYRAHRGWDACTGWGSPRGDRLAAALAQVADEL